MEDLQLQEDKEYLSKYLEEGSLRSSKWFRALPANTSASALGKYIPSMTKLISYVHKGCLVDKDPVFCNALGDNFATAKTCPGLKNILEECIIVKSPCDILITIDESGSWVYSTPAESLIKLVEEHTSEQFGYPFQHEDLKLMENKRVIKFKLPIHLGTDGDAFIHLDPQMHDNRSPLSVVNGVISPPATKISPLNIITTYELPAKGSVTSINISRGDALAYLWGGKKIKLVPKKGLPSMLSLVHDRFINSFGARK